MKYQYNTRLRDLLECYDLEVRNSEPTHNLGGQLDVVVSRRDGSCSAVTTYDAGVSDHQLLTWSVDGSRAVAPATTVDFRPWRTVNVDEFRAALTATPLCDADQWAGRSVDELVQLYDRPRQSDPWFDLECRSAKRLTRQLERALPLPDVVMTTLRLLLLPTRGALNDASTVTSANRSVPLSGCRQWRPRDQIQSVSGRPLTRC